jgi:tetratricopeptide (TPR) repeat protein
MKFEVRGVKVELPTLKIVLYVVLLLTAASFGTAFYQRYNRFMDESSGRADADITDPKLQPTARVTLLSSQFPRLIFVGAVFFVSVVVFAVFLSHDVTELVAGRTIKALYDDEGEGIMTPEYELAEAAWADGDFMEAIRLLREHLRKNPNAQHAALRIAEIYEKDMQNYLAAALEYEEVLKHNLEPERWGWTAIHLCNLYYKVGKPDQATALLKRIAIEYGRTAAAEKARKRLEQEGVQVPTGPDAQECLPKGESPSKLPPGFGPLKSSR